MRFMPHQVIDHYLPWWMMSARCSPQKILRTAVVPHKH